MASASFVPSTTTSEVDDDDDEEEEEVPMIVVVQREDEWIETDFYKNTMNKLWRDGIHSRDTQFTKIGTLTLYSPPFQGALENVRERYHQLNVRDIEHEEIGNQQQKSSNNGDEPNENGDHAAAADEEEDDNDTTSKGGDILSTMILIAALEDALHYRRHCNINSSKTSNGNRKKERKK